MAQKPDQTSSVDPKTIPLVNGNENEDQDEEVFDVQHASDIYGEWGPLQRNATIFYIGIYLVASFQNHGVVFYTPSIDYNCKLPPGAEGKNVSKCFEYEGSDQPCTQWEYDHSFYKSTLIDAFDLVCGREYFISMSKSIYQFGFMVASILTGWMSDKYGRLYTFKISIFVELVASLSQALSPNIYFYLFSRVFLGIGSYGRFTTGMLLCKF